MNCYPAAIISFAKLTCKCTRYFYFIKTPFAIQYKMQNVGFRVQYYGLRIIEKDIDMVYNYVGIFYVGEAFRLPRTSKHGTPKWLKKTKQEAKRLPYGGVKIIQLKE